MRHGVPTHAAASLCACTGRHVVHAPVVLDPAQHVQKVLACQLTSVPLREWPYDHIVPGIPKNDPPYRGGRQKGHKREHAREEKLAKIEAAMAKMPQLIADYRVRRCRGLCHVVWGRRQGEEGCAVLWSMKLLCCQHHRCQPAGAARPLPPPLRPRCADLTSHHLAHTVRPAGAKDKAAMHCINKLITPAAPSWPPPPACAGEPQGALG